MYKAKDTSFQNESAPYIAEFFMRQRLAKLGYVTNFDDLDSVTAEAFIAIDSEIEKYKAEAMSKPKGIR